MVKAQPTPQAIQERLAELLWNYLKRDPETKDRRQTGWGTKTKQGLGACIERIVDEARAEAKAAEEADAAEQGNACPECGGHSFRIQATFAGDICVTFEPTAEDPEDFTVTDSNPTDSEWDGPVECLDCDWSGDLKDLKLVIPDGSEDKED